MSVAEERVARSVALEKAYVHDVYEQFSDGPRGKPWPKVNQFLADLEPGSLVCDVGCGNGKYLNTNPSVFNIGSDKCMRLTKVAREKENEVLVCDNLALPYRDESFDAVLSVAVVHHFATTERRVCALRELARILRIGGRLIISVWAMEQTHRKFESQDVLVPWHRPQTLSTPSLELTSTTNTSEEDVLPPYHAYTQTSDSDSNKSIRTKSGLRKRGRTRHKGRSIDPGRSSSPSSSSLSSPNETCYSFVRRAIQKLAGGKRSGNSHRPWFLETWNSCTKEPIQKRYDPDGCENYDGNIQDLPIELRRVDDDEMPQRRQTFPSSQISIGNEFGGIKSKSLTDIKMIEERQIVRSQSSVPSLQNEASFEETPVPVEIKRTKPKLVKQKQSICDEDLEEALDKPTDMQNLVNALPEFKVQNGVSKRGSVCKQRSMNEELMSTERLREKESVKRNIQKQASLNEDLIYERNILRESFFSVSTSKRFQLIKSGFTNTIKNSTNNIEKVAGSSLKNGFVRMFQGWKANEIIVSPTQTEEITVVAVKPVINTEEKKDGERRHSKEDGSDSSKDSSLQSDTSVDSEDSFASVIFVPKADPLSPTPLSSGPTSPRLKQTSVPNSPRMKNASCPTSPRIKQMPLTVYPLTKQLSSPKPSSNTPNTPLTPTSTANTKITLSLPSRVELKLMRNQVEPEENHANSIDTSPKIITPTIIKPVDITIQRALEMKENSMKLIEASFEVTEVKSVDVENIETIADFQQNPIKFKGKSMEFKENPFDFTEKLVASTTKTLEFNVNLVRPKETSVKLKENALEIPEKLLEVQGKPIEIMEAPIKLKEPSEKVVESQVKPVGFRRNPFENTDKHIEMKLLESKENPSKVKEKVLVELQENPLEDTVSLIKLPLDHTEKQTDVKDIPLVPNPVKLKEKLNPYKLKEIPLKLKEDKLTVSKSESLAQKYSVVRIPKFRKYNESLTLKHRHEFNGESRTEDKKRTERLRQIRELLNNRPGFGIRASRSAFPIVRHSSVRSGGRIEAIARPLPRLLSLELFNPETDDKDSDSSGASSPDSVDSVINIEVTDNSQGTKSEDETPVSRKPSPTKFAFPPIAETSPTTTEHLNLPPSDSKPKLCVTSMSLLEAAADVANSLDDAVEVVMKSSPRTKRRKDVQKILRQSSTTDTSVIESTWDEECHKHLTDFADKLSEKLLLEIDQYQEQSRKVETERFNSAFGHIDDPYIHRLSEELKDLNKLSAEIQKQNQYLSQLSKNDLALTKQLELDLDLTDLNVECKKCRNKQCKCERIHEFSDTNSDKVFFKPTIAEPSDNFDNGPKEDSTSKPFHRLSRESSDASAPGEASRSSLLLQHSIESTDTADLSEMTTASGSDSQKDTNSVSRYSDCGSTASLGSNPEWSKLKPKLPNGLTNRSASQDKPQSDDSSMNDHDQMMAGNCGSLNASLSDTSQDSLPSDNIGGSITYHRYYHVFREGELDQLIERYVENLHIISSYYDHASWCVVAEKVQVWTI